MPLHLAERNYSQLEHEGLAIIFGIQKFNQYLYGRRFTLVTDNKPLSLILGTKKGIPVLAASRLQRSAIQLSAYQYDIQYRAGNLNQNADALSRLPFPVENKDNEGSLFALEEVTKLHHVQLENLPVKTSDIRAATLNDPVLSRVRHFTVNGWPTQQRGHQKSSHILLTKMSSQWRRDAYCVEFVWSYH